MGRSGEQYQVTEAGERSIELRALVSAQNASDAWNLRCLVREGLISYLRANHPDCLPRTRAELTEPAPPASPEDGIANRKLKA